jgi:hypothetical protein
MMRKRELPKVSCFCSTYGRVQCLEEAIFSFLQQDYVGEKELIVLNDREDQVLVFDHPEVKILNNPDRIEPLGRKFNINVNYCSGDVIAVWENDDIALPHRLTFSIERMKNGVFHTNTLLYEEERQRIVPSGNYAHVNLMLTRDLFNNIGGYPEIDSCTVDTGIFARIEAKVGSFSQQVDPRDAVMIYRWKTIASYHGSGQGPTHTRISEVAKAAIDAQIASGIEPVGVINLNPHWDYNYADYIKLEEA